MHVDDVAGNVGQALGRGETIGEAPLLAGGRYPNSAMCLRDSELVRMVGRRASCTPQKCSPTG